MAKAQRTPAATWRDLLSTAITFVETINLDHTRRLEARHAAAAALRVLKPLEQRLRVVRNGGEINPYPGGDDAR